MGELKQDLVEVEGLHLNQKQAYEYYRLYFSEHPEKLDTRQSPKAMIAEGLELLKINSCKLPEELTLKISNLISETYSDISIDEYDVNEVLVALCYVCKPEQEG